ncbi:leucine-rich repeat domain-containing protein [Streptomyces sp. FH025]|uniref:leucine-rich repeat domain-containing protein n=1 Tax=Streptomyces sp. FH025 TaxID=2815937 RepID=UPI001A9D9219|nr:leucine-rich repeat domain-containing protein [Streptomyces sp. FH025]MBO1416419.1 leucine-rich repeat domain-containing protein [Streptomyces sp. FH025]
MPIILDLLPGPDGLADDEIGPALRTAAMVGGDAALSYLKQFRDSSRFGASAMLRVGWLFSSFDPVEYAQEILAHQPPPLGVSVKDAAQLAALPMLPPVHSLSCAGPFTAADVLAVPHPASRSHLHLADNPVLDDLGFVRDMSALTHLDLYGCPLIDDLSPLRGLRLQRLSLDVGDIANLDVLDTLPDLFDLFLGMPLPYRSLEAVPAGERVTELRLHARAYDCTGIEGIGRWERLTKLGLYSRLRPGDLSRLIPLTTLTHLLIARNQDLGDSALPQVADLSLVQLETAPDLDRVLALFPGLHRLSVIFLHTSPDTNVDLTPLASREDLVIYVNGAGAVHGAEKFQPDMVKISPRPRV